MFPAFDPNTTDYVIRCTDDPVVLAIAAPEGTTVSVDGQQAAGGRFTATVNRSTGQGFTIVVQVPSQAPAVHFVRCLPLDYPNWTASRTGTTQAEYYITPHSLVRGTYPTIFDNDGVPVWWAPKTATLFAELLPDGNVAWTKTDSSPAEERRLDGALVASITTSAGPPDLHDLLRLANGNYVMVANVLRADVDFGSWGPTARGRGP